MPTICLNGSSEDLIEAQRPQGIVSGVMIYYDDLLGSSSCNGCRCTTDLVRCTVREALKQGVQVSGRLLLQSADDHRNNPAIFRG